MNNYSWFELIYSEWVCVFIVCAMKLCVVVNVCKINTCLCVSRVYLILNSRGTSQYLHSVTMSIAGPGSDNDNLPLILGLSLGIGVPVLLLIFILLLCCCCECCPWYRKCRKRKFFIHSSLINTCILGMCGIHFLFLFGFQVLKKLRLGSE